LAVILRTCTYLSSASYAEWIFSFIY
jgi:hypothetical protein